MNKYFKILFVMAIFITGFFILKPVIDHEQKRTDIIFFGAGDADSILIKNQSNTILIDTGLRADRKVLADKLKRLGVREIDYMILTHPDKDHIGGASYIIDNFIVNNLIQSKYEKETKHEARIKNALKNKSIKNVILKKDFEITLGDLKVKIITPKEEKYKKSNDYSLITLIEDRELNYLFAADAEKILTKELLDISLPTIDVYKVPHHGKANSNSEALIDKIKPQVSIITNKDGEEKVISALESIGSEIYYAFKEDIHVYTDGKEVRIK